MKSLGLKASRYAYSALLGACAGSSMVAMGSELFSEAQEDGQAHGSGRCAVVVR